ncbi:MAG: MFS transporter [Patescibacteria group bacterium]
MTKNIFRSLDKNIIVMTFGFFLLFLAFNAAQAHVAIFFQNPRKGIFSLFLIYLFFTLFNPFAAALVSKWGARNSLFLGGLTYTVYMFTFATDTLSLVYIASILLGCGAALLWTAQESYLMRLSEANVRGRNAGFFEMIWALSAIGTFIFSLFTNSYNLKTLFVVCAIFAFLALIPFTALKDTKQVTKNQARLIKKTLFSLTAYKIAIISLAMGFCIGLVIGPLPVLIKNSLGQEWVGKLLSFYFLFSFFIALSIGKSSDVRGRTWYIILAYVIALAGLLFFYLNSSSIALVICVVCLAFNFSVFRIMNMALVGDLSNGNNLEFVASILLMGTNTGILLALLLSTYFSAMSMFGLAIIIQIVSFCIAYITVLNKPLSITQQKLSREIF